MTILKDRFALEAEPAARGGMSIVFRATDLQWKPHRTVAVKFFQVDQPGSSEMIKGAAEEAFRRETEALSLRHPNIVELLDSGYDEASGRPYLVLEWLPRNLAQMVAQTKAGAPAPECAGFDSFYEAIGRPILLALSMAHGRDVIHRDVKPSNILLGEDGEVKLADFSISKIKRHIGSSRTLSQFVSEPFSPPDVQEEPSARSRDTWGFAACVVDALSTIRISDQASLRDGLADLDVVDAVHGVLSQALSLDKARRYENAKALLADLDDIQQQRQLTFDRAKLFLGMRISFGNRQRLRQELGLSSPEQLEGFLRQDFSGTVAALRVQRQGVVTPDQYELLGARLRLQVVVDKDTQCSFVVTNGWAVSEAQMERKRQDAWSFSAEIEWRAPQTRERERARTELEKFESQLQEYLAAAEVSRKEEGRLSFVRGREAVLRVLRDSEDARKQQTIRFYDRSVQGRRVTFETGDFEIVDSLDGESWKWESGDSRVTGTVTLSSDRRVVLVVERGEAEAIPNKGRLLYDSWASEQSIRRQEEALSATKFQRSTRSDLVTLLADPSRAATSLVISDGPTPAGIDPMQWRAISAACSPRPLVVIEGPPGTGKTRVIAEVIKRLWATQPTPRIVLASQTHVALDNALERLEQEFIGEGRRPEILRVGHPDDPRISSTVKHLLLDETLKRWAREVEDRSREWLAGFSTERGLARDVLTVAWHVKRLIGEKLAMESLESQLVLLSDDGAPGVREKAVQAVLNDSSALDEMAPEARARVRDKLARHRAQQDRIVKELRTLGKDEAALADKETSYLKELLEGLLRDLPQEQQFLAMLDVQSSWLQEFGADPKEFSRALLVRADIVAGTCIGLAGVDGFQEADFDLAILDEASKATTLESLVPLSRARKLVLVGDPKQLPPFNREVAQSLLERHDVSKEDLTQTMLDIVRDSLPADNCVRLETQFRMVPPIGQLISEVFYDGGLRGGSERRSAALSAVFPTPVTWLTTSFEEDKNESRVGRSFANNREVDVVQAVLFAISEESEKLGEELSVALLTGYAAQRDALGRMVHSLSGRMGGLKLDWGTVDAYQGREADICIYSVTRSNAESGQGFLADERRMNVALSRGSLGLIVVGDHKFCEKSQVTKLARVLAFMRAHDDTCKVFSAAGKGY